MKIHSDTIGSLAQLEYGCRRRSVDAEVNALIAAWELLGEWFADWREAIWARRDELDERRTEYSGPGRWSSLTQEFYERLDHALRGYDEPEDTPDP